MRVVVTSFGSDGDVNPLLAIAAALVRRGAEVTFVANPFYEPRVRRTGSVFVAAGPYLDLVATLADNPRYLRSAGGVVAVWNDLVAPAIRYTFPALRETVRAVDAQAVVSHVMSYAGSWAAAEAGIGNVVVTTTAMAWLSRHHPSVFANWRAPHAVQGAVNVAMREVGRRILARTLRGLAAQVGAATPRGAVPDADLNLGVWPDWFRPPAGGDPPHAATCGFVFDAAGATEPLGDELATFLADGDPPVVAGFGSAASLHGARRYQAVADACERLGRRCVLLGRSAAAVTPRRDRLVLPSASYARTFPAACAVVHHGGFGTSAEALRAGRRSLITPFAFDQFDTAARVQDAGCGRWFRGDAESADAVAAALDAVLRTPALAVAAGAAAARIASAPAGADRAAELIATVAAR